MSITMFTSDNIPALVPMPGEFLLDFLSERKRSQRKLAGIIDKTPTEINDIIKGRKSINADFAVRFGIAFGTSAELRLNMQIGYDLYQLKKLKEKRATFKAIEKRSLALV